MRWRFAIALAAVLAVAGLWYWSSGHSQGAVFESSKGFDLPKEDPHFGGLSGYEAGPDGQGTILLTDRGHLYIGDDQGGYDRFVLRGSDGPPLPHRQRDSEGLALLFDGRLAISFEGDHRVMVYAQDGALLEALPRPEGFERLGGNAGLEALAVAPDGALVAIPERSGDVQRPFSVFVYDGEWRVFSLPRRGAFLPVGADFGPDGRLYLLERDYLLSGFRSRIRRFDWGGETLSGEETLLQTRFWTHGNLEGIAVFEERGETIIEMVSDNNFLPIQETELVRYKLIAP